MELAENHRSKSATVQPRAGEEPCWRSNSFAPFEQSQLCIFPLFFSCCLFLQKQFHIDILMHKIYQR